MFYGTEQAKNEARSGFAVGGQGTTGFMTYSLQGLSTIVPALNDDAAGAKNAIALTAAGVAHTAAYGIISTLGKTRTEQVEAGILYAQFCLHARALGLVMQPLSQVLQEYPTMAARYAAIHADYPSAAKRSRCSSVSAPHHRVPGIDEARCERPRARTMIRPTASPSLAFDRWQIHRELA